MKAYNLFKVYIWLIQTIYQHNGITFEEINELWCRTDMSGGLKLHRSTFNRHRNAIEDIFGLSIECNKNNGFTYYLSNGHALEEDSVQNWLLSTLSVNNVISESISLQNRIQIEAIPDDRYLPVMIEAMKNSYKVEIEYRRFGADDAKRHVFAPYALKVYEKRWYVLGFFEERVKENGEKRAAHFTVFSFDRIESVNVLNEKFRLKSDFCLKDYFRDSFGIVSGDGMMAERIVLRAYGREVYSMRSLPLHHSQQEIHTTNEFSDFELCMKPTMDFVGKLLSRGSWVEVMEPQSLRDEVAQKITEMQARYS